MSSLGLCKKKFIETGLAVRRNLFLYKMLGSHHTRAHSFVCSYTDCISVPVCIIQWDKAIELSRIHSSRDINSLLVKCAGNLLDKEKILGAIELYPNISGTL